MHKFGPSPGEQGTLRSCETLNTGFWGCRTLPIHPPWELMPYPTPTQTLGLPGEGRRIPRNLAFRWRIIRSRCFLLFLHKNILYVNILMISNPIYVVLPGKYCCHSEEKRLLKPVYTCDFWCDFAYKTRLTLPCTNAFFAKYRVDWKESYHILFEDTLLSKFC